MRPGGLVHRVGAAIRDHRLWDRGDRVIVAVSGGLDSVVLLDTLVATATWHGGALEVATIDHGLRPGSASDADFVESLAASHALPWHRANLGLPLDSSEEASRRARYAALDAFGGACVALAHHERDQAETLLVQAMRGTGLGGLSGMPYRFGRRVRPLLEVPHEHLRAFASDRQLTWREDPTNQSTTWLRNRVRHEVLPALERVRPGATRALARTAMRAGVDLEFLDAILAEYGGATEGVVPRSALAAPGPVARLAVRRAFRGLAAVHVDAVLAAAPGQRVEVPGGTIFVGDEGLKWLPVPEEVESP